MGRGKFHPTGRTPVQLLKARDQRDANDQHKRTHAAHQVEGVRLNVQQAEVVNGEGHNDRGADVERGVSARTDLAD